MTKRVSTILLGAGTAALAAGNRLLDSGDNGFLILEKGNNLINRACPGAKKHTCKFCIQGCFMVEGVGGANALYGNKICYFPASSEILNFCNEDEKIVALQYLNNFKPYLDSSNITFNFQDQEVRKYYTSDVLSKIEYKLLISSLSAKLLQQELLLSNVDIIKIYKKNKEFVLIAKNGAKFICKNLVFATGRSSHAFLKQEFDSLKIQYSPLHQDIGFRIETNKANFNANYYYQVDPKIKFDFPSIGSARTFCAHNQGLVVPIQFGNSFFADGAFSDNYLNDNNIALMVRMHEPIDNSKIQEWCKKINEYCNQSLVLKRINLVGKSNYDIAEEIYSAMPFYPTETHQLLMKKLIINLFDSNEYGILESKFVDSELTIYAPAIDRYWVSPILDNNLQTKNVENCYVIGDAMGQSRGIFQAMFSGVAWANKFLSAATKNITNDKIWSGRVSASI